MRICTRRYIIILSILTVLAIGTAAAEPMSNIYIPANVDIKKIAENVKNVDYDKLNELINAKPEDFPMITEDLISGIARADYIYYGKFDKSDKFDKFNATIGSFQATSISNYCYKKFGKWNSLPISYIINPSNSQGISQSTITSNIFASAEAWDSVVSKNLFTDTYGIDSGANYGTYDQRNVIDFGQISNSGVIAVTSIWYNIYTKQIVEFDLRFNTVFKWGDATTDSYQYLMDIRNIATHELGHGAGLNDLYQSYCSQATMYGYSNYRETKKRSLESGDIRGIRLIYGT